MNEYYNSLLAFEINRALVGKRDYSWLCIILLLTSECSCDELTLTYPSQEDLQMLNCDHCKQFLVLVHTDVLAFDRYLNCSLKGQCREKRTSGRQIKYIIRNSTPLEGIKLKDFLSHIEIKSDLTTCLAEYCVKELKNR